METDTVYIRVRALKEDQERKRAVLVNCLSILSGIWKGRGGLQGKIKD